MKSSFSSLLSFLLLASAAAGVSGLDFRIKKRSATVTATNDPTSRREQLTTTDSWLFVADVTINGVDVPVVVNTGSSDLWIMEEVDIGETEDTDVDGLSLSYLIDEVFGDVAVASFEFGSYHVDKQALLVANQDTFADWYRSMGVYGQMGLGFPNASKIRNAIIETYGPDATWGDTTIQNIVNLNPELDDFFAIRLDRTEDLEATESGSITIGEVEDDYAEVEDMPVLSQYPHGSDKWTVLLDSIRVNGHDISLPTSDVHNAPEGKLVALLDSSSNFNHVPAAVADAICSSIPGAAKLEELDLWVVNCSVPISVEYVFGGQSYAMHPLDTTILEVIPVDGTNYTACGCTFWGDDSVGGDEYDLIAGTPFLLNTYSKYDFGGRGEESDTAYVQLLALTDPTEASDEFAVVRSANLAVLPQELPAQEFVDKVNESLTPGDEDEDEGEDVDDEDVDDEDDAEDDDEDDDEDDGDEDEDEDDVEESEENPDGTPFNGDEDEDEEDDDDDVDVDEADEDEEDEDDDNEPDDDIIEEEEEDADEDDEDEADEDDDEDEDGDVLQENPNSRTGSGNAGSRINANSADDSSSVGGSSIDKYAPAMLGLLAANLFVGIGLLALAIVGLARRGKETTGTRKSRGAYSTVGANDEATPGYGQYQKPYDS